MSATEQVFHDALALPIKDRAKLAQQLLESFDRPEDSAEVEAAWKAEILDRCEAADRGEMDVLDGDEVMRRLYQTVK